MTASSTGPDVMELQRMAKDMSAELVETGGKKTAKRAGAVRPASAGGAAAAMTEADTSWEEF